MGRHSPQLNENGTVKYKPMVAERGPGPAAYSLRGTTGQRAHCPSKKQSPAYSFGLRTKQFEAARHGYSTSPGPIYYIEPNMTRKGKDGPPVYTLHDRLKTIKDTCSPGPAAYHVGTIKPLRQANPPMYSFGSRTGDHRGKNMNPAPNSYTLPSLTGVNPSNKKQNPAYSMTGRSKVGGFNEDLSNTPGPGAYKPVSLNVYTNQSPIYSLHDRNPAPLDGMKVPGPGAHSPEKVTATLRSAPKFSFGIRHSEYIEPCRVRGKDMD